ncbi:MAG: hypothetical protein IPH93_16640 [Saprospiraceae bacterium]|nr:hypothetical protein [Saprospiraceae bacterium]
MSNEYIGCKFLVESRSNIDWIGVHWSPKMVCLNQENAFGGNTITSPITVLSIVQFPIYKYFISSFSPDNGPARKSYNNIYGVISSDNKNYFIHPNFSNSLTSQFEDCGSDPVLCLEGKVNFVIKQSNKVIANRELLISENSIDINLNDPILISITDDYSKILTIDLISDGSFWADQLLKVIDNPSNLNEVLAYYSLSNDVVNPNDGASFPLTRLDFNLLHRSNDLSGDFYRQWGQFLYNESEDKNPNQAPSDAFGKLLNLDKKGIPTLTTTEAGILNNLNINNYQSLQSVLNAFDVNDLSIKIPGLESISNLSFLYFYPKPTRIEVEQNGMVYSRNIWSGLSNNNFASAYSARSLGMLEALEHQVGIDPEEQYIPGDSETGAFSVTKLTESNPTGASYGVNAGPIGVGQSETIESHSSILSDYFDINGDRYPDIVYSDNVFQTNGLGGLYPIEFEGPGSKCGQKAWENTGLTNVVGQGKSLSGTYRPGEPHGPDGYATGDIKSRLFRFCQKIPISTFYKWIFEYQE